MATIRQFQGKNRPIPERLFIAPGASQAQQCCASTLGAFFCPYKRFVPRLVGPDLKQFSRVCSRLVLTIRSAISCFKIQAVCAIILRSAFWARFSLFARDSSPKSALEDGRGKDATRTPCRPSVNAGRGSEKAKSHPFQA